MPSRLILVADAGLAADCRLGLDHDARLVEADLGSGGGHDAYPARILRPLLHNRQHQMEREAAAGYERFVAHSRHAARDLATRLEPTDQVWINNYPLLALGAPLRAEWKGSLGFYLHAPFAPPEVMAALPHAAKLRELMLVYDAIGFQAQRHLENFAAWACAARNVRRVSKNLLVINSHHVRLFHQPVGINVTRQRALANNAPEEIWLDQGIRRFQRRKQIVAFDRDLLNGGSLERLASIKQLLTEHRELRERIAFLQVAPIPPAHSIDMKRWTSLAGRTAALCGPLATLGWEPVRLLGTEPDPASLAGLYRSAAVGMFTALAEGTSLEAKRFVASQDPNDPAALVLSAMSGAAEELAGALMVNPYDHHAAARCLHEALALSLHERQSRHQRLLATVRANDMETWLATLGKTLSPNDVQPAPPFIETAAA